MIVLARVGDAAADVGDGIFRIELDRLVVVLDGAVVVALALVGGRRGRRRRRHFSDRAGSPGRSPGWRGRGRPCSRRRGRG